MGTYHQLTLGFAVWLRKMTQFHSVPLHFLFRSSQVRRCLPKKSWSRNPDAAQAVLPDEWFFEHRSRKDGTYLWTFYDISMNILYIKNVPCEILVGRVLKLCLSNQTFYDIWGTMEAFCMGHYNVEKVMQCLLLAIHRCHKFNWSHNFTQQHMPLDKN